MKVFKEYIYPVLLLTVICVVITIGLVATNNLTAPIIEASRGKEANAARIELLPDADDFEQVELTGDVASAPWFVDAYKAKNGAGYVITTTTNGFGGPFKVMTGIDKDGKITNVKMIEHSETAGYGTKAEEPDYTKQYVGKDKELNGVQPISGASTTTAAFEKAVQYAFDAFTVATGGTVEVEKELTPEQKIFPDCETFTKIEIAGADAAYKAEGFGVVVVTHAVGYHGEMQVYTGFAPDGTIAGVALGENGETQGLGTKVGDEAYTSQFVGKTEVKGINPVTSATYSSNGFNNAVKAAIELLPAIQDILNSIAG